MRGSWLLGVALGATLLTAGEAHALTCGPPPSQLLWSYPSATTEVVPTNAVFRAFGAAGYSTRIVFELDGRELPSAAAELEVDSSYDEATRANPAFLDVARRWEYPRESAEFVPPEPLTPGEHEVVIRVLGYLESGDFELMEAHRFTVRAEEQPGSTSDVAISAVTLYSWNDRWGQPRAGEYPPPEVSDGACEIPSSVVSCAYGLGSWGPPGPDVLASGPATRVELPRHEGFGTRIDLAASGPALGYLIGSEFVPADCSAVLGGSTGVALDQDSPPSAVSFYARAVLPTGLGEPHGFTGDVSIVENSGTAPEAIPYPESHSGLCSAHAAGARTSGSDLASLALFIASTALLRRSRRALQLPPRA